MKNVFRRSSNSQLGDGHRSSDGGVSDSGSVSLAGDAASLSEPETTPSGGAKALLSMFASVPSSSPAAAASDVAALRASVASAGEEEGAIKARLRELEAQQQSNPSATAAPAAPGPFTGSTGCTAGTGTSSCSTSVSASSTSSSSTREGAAPDAEGEAGATRSGGDTAPPLPEGRPPLPTRKSRSLPPLDDVEKAGDAATATAPAPVAERSSSFSSSGLLAAGTSSLASLASLIGVSPRHRSVAAPSASAATSSGSAAAALVSGWGSSAGKAGEAADTGEGDELQQLGEEYDGTETLSRNHPIVEMLRHRSQLAGSSSSSSSSSSAAVVTDAATAAAAAAADMGKAALEASAPPQSSHSPPPPASVPAAPAGPNVPPTPSSSLAAAALGAPPHPSPVAAGGTTATSLQEQNGAGGPTGVLAAAAAAAQEEHYTPFAPRQSADYHYGYVDKLVLKNNEESAFVIGKGGGTIGRGPKNTVSVPSDITLQGEGHALIGYKNGSFFLKNQGASHCAAIRIGTEPGLRAWPLELGATFSAGNSVFVVKDVAGGDLILEITDGPLKGERRKVQRKAATIGRSPDNTLSVSDPELSRRHSRIEFDESDGKYYVSDVGSTNGTYMQLVGPYGKVFHLALSDQIMVGRTGFSVNRFDYGISEERGRRKTMEDHTLVIQDLGIRSLKRFGLAPQTFAAVFDGHGGEEASAYLSQHLHLNLKKALEQAFAGAPVTQAGLALAEVDARVEEAVMSAFVKTDEDFLAKGDLDAGSTATTVLIMGKRVYSCNVGDSRTIISREHALVLTSSDHKPSREDEARRIREAGGFIFQNRVMGELAVSRAFGDRELKKCMQDIMAPEELHQMALRDAKHNAAAGNGEEVMKDYSQPLVIARPEILVAELTEKDDFVLLACDGLFDVFSNQEVVRFVLDEMRQHHDAQRACENLSYTAIHQRIAHDNVSIVLLVANKWW